MGVCFNVGRRGYGRCQRNVYTSAVGEMKNGACKTTEVTIDEIRADSRDKIINAVRNMPDGVFMIFIHALAIGTVHVPCSYSNDGLESWYGFQMEMVGPVTSLIGWQRTYERKPEEKTASDMYVRSSNYIAKFLSKLGTSMPDNCKECNADKLYANSNKKLKDKLEASEALIREATYMQQSLESFIEVQSLPYDPNEYIGSFRAVKDRLFDSFPY